MNISDHGLQFIIGWEGVRYSAYDDGGPGVGNCTIGVGHLIHLGPCSPAELAAPPLSPQTVTDLLRVDVRRFENVVNSHATVPLNQNQFDALCDFCFNTGGGYPQVWNAVNNGGDVCAVLVRTAITPAWATAALVRRRKAECQLYNTPVTTPPVEDEDMPFLVWAPQQQRTYLVGPKGAYWVMSQSLSNELVALFGPVKMAVSNDALNAIGVVS